MNPFQETFKDLQQKGERALVGFVTAGDPSLERSEEVISALLDAGTDILELGVPFSDPTADGPVIQRASGRALKAGVNLNKVLALTAKIRTKSNAPVVLFSYYNPILAYGLSRFYEHAVEAGVDGLLTVDLPFEEFREVYGAFPGEKLPLIRLVAPTTPKDRMALIARKASGFLYLVSMTGVTGSSGLDIGAVEKTTARLKSITELPVCVGFGVSTPEQVSAVAKSAEGVVVGSAFERLIEKNLHAHDLAQRIHDYAAQLKQAARLTEGCRSLLPRSAGFSR